MTEDEAIEQMSDLPFGDTEAAHSGADGILLRFLADNGYKRLVEAFMEADIRAGGFWYA